MAAENGEQAADNLLYDAVYDAVREALYGDNDVDPVGWATEQIMAAVNLHRPSPAVSSTPSTSPMPCEPEMDLLVNERTQR